MAEADHCGGSPLEDCRTSCLIPRLERILIEYVVRSGPPEAMNCPTVVCDACRQQVFGSGNIVWAHKAVEEGEAGQVSPLYAAHKGRCDRAVDAWLKSQYGSGWLILWEEAEVFMRQLARNLVRNFADDKDGTYRQTIVKHPSDPHREIPAAAR